MANISAASLAAGEGTPSIASPTVITGRGSATFALKLLHRFQNEDVAGTLLHANDRLGPTALQDMMRAAVRIEARRPVIVAVADTDNSFFQRVLAMLDAQVAVFSENGIHGIVTVHLRSSLVGTAVILEGTRGLIPSVFRFVKQALTLPSGAYA